MDVQDAGLAVAFVASLLINAGFLVMLLQRQTGKFLIDGDDETFLLRNRKTGAISRLDHQMKVKPGDRRIVTFEKRHRLSFPVYDRMLRQLSERELTDTHGGISLRIHTTTPAPFPVITNDGHSVLVTASVSFAVEKDRAYLLAKLADFGSQLERRIHSAFSSAIGALRDEEMRQMLGKIEADVTKELEAMEREAKFGVPLGIKIYEARFQYEDADKSPARDITIVSSGAAAPLSASPRAGGEPDSAAGTASPQVVTLQTRASADPSAGRPGAMQFAGTELDKLLDQFKGRSPDQIAALMKLMELQTRQNIVATLAETGGVIVFSAKELGLDGNPVVEDAVMNALLPPLSAPKAAE